VVSIRVQGNPTDLAPCQVGWLKQPRVSAGRRFDSGGTLSVQKSAPPREPCNPERGDFNF